MSEYQLEFVRNNTADARFEDTAQAARKHLSLQFVSADGQPASGDGLVKKSISPGSGSLKNAKGDNPNGAVAPTTPAERRAAETLYFKYLFDKKNMLLDPFQTGEGPEQVLHRMNDSGKLGKNPWSVEKIHQEAQRISRRDLQNEKHSYSENQQTKMFSDREISDLVKQTVDRVKGIDVSHFDIDINWKDVKASGIDFAFLKATGAKRDGTTVVDEKFQQNRQGAKEAGVATGYYHFFRPDVPMDKQIELFAKTVGKVGKNSLPLVMDVEEDEKKPMWGKAADGHTYSVAERLKLIDAFCNGVKKILGKDTPIAIYTSPKFVREFLGSDSSLNKYTLWDASWKLPEPVVPAPWERAAFWQYAGDNGKVAGIHRPDGEGVDLDMIIDPTIASMLRKGTLK